MRRLEARRLSQTPCGFAIGTSDESEDADGDEDREDLQKLFCPLTDSNGSPYEQDGNRLHPMFGINSDHVSASSCR